MSIAADMIRDAFDAEFENMADGTVAVNGTEAAAIVYFEENFDNSAIAAAGANACTITIKAGALTFAPGCEVTVNGDPWRYMRRLSADEMSEDHFLVSDVRANF